jgi:hypothetical protein
VHSKAPLQVFPIDSGSTPGTETGDRSEVGFIASNESNLDMYCWCEVREHCTIAIVAIQKLQLARSQQVCSMSAAEPVDISSKQSATGDKNPQATGTTEPRDKEI